MSTSMSMSMSMIISSLHCLPAWRNPPTLLHKRFTISPLNKYAIRTLRTKSVNLGYAYPHQFKRRMGICVRAESEVGGERMRTSEEDEKQLEDMRGTSTMPDRFRYLTKEASSPPLRWPWLIALGFFLYAWRSVLWELSNWRKVALGIFQFLAYMLKVALALIFHFIGDPITYAIFYIELAVYAIRSFYSSIVTSAPITELALIILLASTVLAIGEAASPNSGNHQHYMLTIAGVVGYVAVKGLISEPVFWLMLLGLFGFARFIKQRDYVSSALPAAMVLASVGEPWLRLLSIISFTALAIYHYSKNGVQGKEAVSCLRKVPFPLLAMALAIGIRLTAKWAGYRHLTWMIL